MRVCGLWWPFLCLLPLLLFLFDRENKKEWLKNPFKIEVHIVSNTIHPHDDFKFSRCWFKPMTDDNKVTSGNREVFSLDMLFLHDTMASACQNSSSVGWTGFSCILLVFIFSFLTYETLQCYARFWKINGPNHIKKGLFFFF